MGQMNYYRWEDAVVRAESLVPDGRPMAYGMPEIWVPKTKEWVEAPDIDLWHDGVVISREEAQKRLGEGVDLGGATEPEDGDEEIRPGMSYEEIVRAGLTVDLPFEAASGDPKPLRYSDGTTFEESFPHLMKPGPLKKPKQ